MRYLRLFEEPKGIEFEAALRPFSNSMIVTFPKTIDFENAKEGFSVIRNQMHGEWERIKRKANSQGLIGYVKETEDPLSRLMFGIISLNDLGGAQIDYDIFQFQLNEHLKYIVTANEDGLEEIFTFPKFIHHDCFHESVNQIDHVYREIVSAGFVREAFICYGESETLGVAMRPTKDTELLLKVMQEQDIKN